MRVGAQRRPLQRRSLGRVLSRSGERRKPRNVALLVQDRGLRNGRRRRQGQDRRRRRRLWGRRRRRRLQGRRGRRRRDLGGRAKRGRRALEVGVGESDLDVCVAPRSFGLRRGNAVGLLANGGRRLKADHPPLRRLGDIRIGELGREVRIAQGRFGWRRRGGRGSGAGGGSGAISNRRPRSARRLRRRGDARGFRRRARRNARRGAIDRRDVGRRRSTPFRRPRNQASGAACRQKRPESEQRHRSSPLE